MMPGTMMWISVLKSDYPAIQVGNVYRFGAVRAKVVAVVLDGDVRRMKLRVMFVR